MSCLKTPNGEAYYSMLKKYVPYELKEKLLREDALESFEQLVCILTMVRSPNLSFLLLKDLISSLISGSFAYYFCSMGTTLASSKLGWRMIESSPFGISRC